jgi:glycosyltransferase involved in cell wall biosynthesis
MTARAPHDAGPPRVALLHSYGDSTKPSMRRYAMELGDALGARGLPVDHVFVESTLPRALLSRRSVALLDGLWGRYARYPAIARGTRASVFHIVDHSFARLAQAVGGSRSIVTCHDVMLLALAAGRIDSPRRDALATFLFRRDVSHLREAAAVVADSECTRQDLIDLVGLAPDRVEVIPPGLDAAPQRGPEAREVARRKFGWNGPTLLQVGHSDFYKNVEGCLEVLARIRRGGLDARLVHAGAPLRPSHFALAERLEVRDAVDDRGLVGDEELEDLYAAADVLLFPSLYEGFGWPPLEAMARRLPVICSTAGSLPEVLGDAALTADPHDHAALAAHVAAVLGDPGKADSLRHRGLVRASLFRWEETARRMELLYRRVTDGE